ncbi:unnamed protein product [Musa acuminata subsp. malaccensis]|uniref:(wild Malaysian banana) hypothetical protein n=1 Tax=Musa acuminata subsp. malaccensis TaxID=214687 RepID=A0A804IYJ7_MUSAM|nr:unnamed protein product [Musa acuminata subsp. malaccensis]
MAANSIVFSLHLLTTLASVAGNLNDGNSPSESFLHCFLNRTGSSETSTQLRRPSPAVGLTASGSGSGAAATTTKACPTSPPAALSPSSTCPTSGLSPSTPTEARRGWGLARPSARSTTASLLRTGPPGSTGQPQITSSTL